MDRSLTRKAGLIPSAGAGMEAPHQASSMRAVAAPCRSPISMVVPRFPLFAEDQPTGTPWYFWRHSALWANPPDANTTPRFARTRTSRPSRFTTAPTTRPSSTTRSSTGDFSHISVPCLRATVMKEAERPAPMPMSRRPRTAPPSPRNTNFAPRMNPPGVDQARAMSQTSSVIMGKATPSDLPREVSHHCSGSSLASKSFTSIARPILPPDRSG